MTLTMMRLEGGDEHAPSGGGRRRKRYLDEAGDPRRLYCFACQQRSGAAQTLAVLSPFSRRMRHVGLCSKHVVPHHIAARIFDEVGLMRFFTVQQQQQQQQQHGGKREHTTAPSGQAK